MYFNLHKSSKEKLKFFDSILYFLASQYSKKVKLDEIQQNSEYTDERIKSLSLLDKFFEEDNIVDTFEKSLRILIDQDYVSEKEYNEDKFFSLTLKGLTITTSKGFLGKEIRERNKYNLQNIIWIVILLSFLGNTIYQVCSFYKPSSPVYNYNYQCNPQYKCGK